MFLWKIKTLPMFTRSIMGEARLTNCREESLDRKKFHHYKYKKVFFSVKKGSQNTIDFLSMFFWKIKTLPMFTRSIMGEARLTNRREESLHRKNFHHYKKSFFSVKKASLGKQQRKVFLV
jgi:hypothetical protein